MIAQIMAASWNLCATHPLPRRSPFFIPWYFLPNEFICGSRVEYIFRTGVSQQLWHLNHGRNCTEIENFCYIVRLFDHSPDCLFVCLFVGVSVLLIHSTLQLTGADGERWREKGLPATLGWLWFICWSRYPNGIKSSTVLQCALVL